MTYAIYPVEFTRVGWMYRAAWLSIGIVHRMTTPAHPKNVIDHLKNSLLPDDSIGQQLLLALRM